MFKRILTYCFPGEEDQKENKILNHFQPFPFWRRIVFIIGLMLIAADFFIDTKIPLTFAAVVILGLILLSNFCLIKRTATTSNMNRYLEQAIDKLKESAMGNFHIKEDELIKQPIVLYAPVVWMIDNVRDQDVIFTPPQRSQSFFSIYHMMFIFMTQSHMHLYQVYYNFLKDKIISEKSIEYYNRDITSISLGEQDISYRLPKNEQTELVDDFRLVKAEVLTIKMETDETYSMIVRAKQLEKQFNISMTVMDYKAEIESIRSALKVKAH